MNGSENKLELRKCVERGVVVVVVVWSGVGESDQIASGEGGGLIAAGTNAGGGRIRTAGVALVALSAARG